MIPIPLATSIKLSLCLINFILFSINQIIANDSPSGKSIFGGDLYKSGVHFKVCEEKIKGFFLAESENESHRGAPIRVCFSGEFVEEENDLFFDVYIYPRIVEILLLIFAFIFLSLSNTSICSLKYFLTLVCDNPQSYPTSKNGFLRLCCCI